MLGDDKKKQQQGGNNQRSDDTAKDTDQKPQFSEEDDLYTE